MDLIAIQRRGGAFESEHRVAAVLCDSTGRVLAATDTQVATTWRSAAKPFQLEGSLSMLPQDVVEGLAPEDLAVGMASHSGEPGHVAHVQALLARFGASEADLRCGAHWPSGEDASRALAREGRVATPIHNNCSGKHAFMVAAARAVGAGPEYLATDHPVQVRVREVVDDRTAGTVVNTVVDGCGAPCFVLPLRGMATAWARFGEATARVQGILGHIGAALLAHPWYASGTGRVDLALIQGAREPLLAKVGAEGLQCLALPSRGLGLAMKIMSGVTDMRAPALALLMERWLPGVLPESVLSDLLIVRNLVGREVGVRSAEWR